MAPIPGAEDQDIDQQLEDHTVRDPGPMMTTQRVPVAALRQPGGELFPDGLNQASWQGRHGLLLIVELSEVLR